MHGNRRYRWEDWFDQPITTLIKGVHYHCSQSAMAGAVRNAASQRRVKVKIIDTGTSIVIEVIGAIPHPDKTAIAS